jgi:ferrous-iron efflux pump FieF
MPSPSDHLKMNMSAGVASVTVALILVALKLWAYLQTQSLSVASSLTDSGLDFIVSLGAVGMMIYAARPPDEDHRFGHSSAEDLTALAQAFVILCAAFFIITAAIIRLTKPQIVTVTAEMNGIWAMVVSILLTGSLIFWQSLVARKTGSRVVAADRLHYLGDFLPNLGAILSLWLAKDFNLPQIDSIVAIGAAGDLRRWADWHGCLGCADGSARRSRDCRRYSRHCRNLARHHGLSRSKNPHRW